MPVNGGSDIEDVDPLQMVFDDDDQLFDAEEDQLTLDDELGYMYPAKMIYPPMEIDSDSDDFDDDEDVDFVYCKLISHRTRQLFAHSSHTQMIILAIFSRDLICLRSLWLSETFRLAKTRSLTVQCYQHMVDWLHWTIL